MRVVPRSSYLSNFEISLCCTLALLAVCVALLYAGDKHQIEDLPIINTGNQLVLIVWIETGFK